MVAIAKSIIHDVFADDWLHLSMNEISQSLSLYCKTHTTKRLEQVLTMLIECGSLEISDNQVYKRAA